MQRDELVNWMNQALNIGAWKDYAPNGLQVQGKADVKKVLVSVTASLACLQKAIDIQADMVLVHHGWFWKGEDYRIVGQRYDRIALAIKHDLNVVGYHLPLDAHPVWGNNVQLAEQLGLDVLKNEQQDPLMVGESELVLLATPKKAGEVKQIETLSDLAVVIEQRLGRRPVVIGDGSKIIHRIALCTGGAQSFYMDAVHSGADVFITGEASERNYHDALEQGVGFISAGHHATERYGIQALGNAIKARFGLDVTYFELDNPI
ncbi:Nif3-like dinuclear metal center hexameric protein [Basilea psittacipulmonis]|uniref:Metal-binding protein n=1 Tax=Basilea psittacipulmonis DSM 24701 TaxID=1072685 RepID=A0A077DF70_9BURK|nr:Nif3-like dinuclear metal center hexameric protein [Basilea psittacipulmonis]AIL32062.1 metal-binding protein [Basilea psittacipulmonis DSM 24701]